MSRMAAPATALAAAARTTELNGAGGKGAKVRYTTYPRMATPVVRMASGSGRRRVRQVQVSAAMLTAPPP